MPPRAGTRFHSPPSLRPPLSARWQEGRGFSAFCGAASCCRCLREGRVRLHQSISLSHSRMLLSLSTSSFSSATRLSRSFTCSHRTQPLSLLSSGTSARLRHSLQPETWTPAFLRGASVWVSTLLRVLREKSTLLAMQNEKKGVLLSHSKRWHGACHGDRGSDLTFTDFIVKETGKKQFFSFLQTTSKPKS